MQTQRLARRVLFGVCFLALAVSPLLAQGMESYALTHPFALSGATTNRDFGMGGIISCVRDHGFPNPAFAATQDSHCFGSRVVLTDFDNGLDFTGFQEYLVCPLRPGESGFQVTYYRLTSNAAPITVPGVGTAMAALSETDLALHYGQRVGDRWNFGIGLSPTANSKVTLSVPGGGPIVAHVSSKPSFGMRLGSAYKIGPDEYAGIVYDNYQEDVTGQGMAFGAALVGAGFRSELLAIGVSKRLDERLLAALEWQWAESRGLGTSNSLSGWHLGGEARLSDQWQARAGMSDGHLTAGLGYESGQWAANYAFVDNWNAEIARPLFGPSDTHMLSVIYCW